MNELLLRRRAMMGANRPTTTLTFSIPADTEKTISVGVRMANGWKTHLIDWGDGNFDVRPSNATTKHTYIAASTVREITVTITGLLSYLECGPA